MNSEATKCSAQTCLSYRLVAVVDYGRRLFDPAHTYPKAPEHTAMTAQEVESLPNSALAACSELRARRNLPRYSEIGRYKSNTKHRSRKSLSNSPFLLPAQLQREQVRHSTRHRNAYRHFSSEQTTRACQLLTYDTHNSPTTHETASAIGETTYYIFLDTFIYTHETHKALAFMSNAVASSLLSHLRIVELHVACSLS